MFVALLRVGYVVVQNRDRGPATVVTASGLKYIDLVEGQGATPQSGQAVLVNYKGTFEDGQEFAESYPREIPSTFSTGTGSLIQGFEEGILTMKVGGKRRLIIPPGLAYGQTGRPPNVPPNATLIFEIELLGVR
jgi:peptidylprolyl isomerase